MHDTVLVGRSGALGLPRVNVSWSSLVELRFEAMAQRCACVVHVMLWVVASVFDHLLRKFVSAFIQHVSRSRLLQSPR